MTVDHLASRKQRRERLTLVGPGTPMGNYMRCFTKLPLETLHAIVKPVWAERAERSNVEPQLASAARFKVISRPVAYDEVVQG